MAELVTLTNLANLQNETTAVNAINANNSAITTAFNDTLSRSGVAPNQLNSIIDMNSNRIINLPVAISVTEPVTLQQMTAALIANGNINTGITGVPVSAAMQPVVNSSTITDAQVLLGITTGGGGGTSPISSFDTRAQAAAASIPTGVNSFRTSGYTTLGDGGAGLYTKTGSLTTGGFQSIDGAYWKLIETTVNPRQFGGVWDGSTDDTNAIQNAVTYAQTYNAEVYFPSGFTSMTGQATITSGLTLTGAGITATYIFCPGAAGQNPFLINGTNSVHMSGFTLQKTGAVSTNTGVIVTAPAGNQNNFSTFHDLVFTNFLTQLDFERAAYWVVENCQFTQNLANGIIIRNTTTPDSGDQTVRNCSFFGGAAGFTAIVWQSGGGTRIINNKFLQVNAGLSLQAVSGVQTGIFIIQGNSFDGCLGAGISVTTADNTNILSDFVITGNDFTGPAPSNASIYFAGATGSALTRITISGNNIAQYTGTGVGISFGLCSNIAVLSNIILSGGNRVVTSGTTNSGFIANNYIAGGSISNSGSGIAVSGNS